MKADAASHYSHVYMKLHMGGFGRRSIDKAEVRALEGRRGGSISCAQKHEQESCHWHHESNARHNGTTNLDRALDHTRYSMHRKAQNQSNFFMPASGGAAAQRTGTKLETRYFHLLSLLSAD